MTHDIAVDRATLTRWHRLAGLVGLIGAALLVTNVARKFELLPTNELTHLLAPLAPLLGLLALVGLASFQRGRVGSFGAAAFLVNAAGLAGAFAIEFVLHGVFPALDADQIDLLVDGRTGTAFLIASVVVMTGAIAFGIASWRVALLPRWAIAAYAVGLTVGSLRMLPDSVYLSALAVAAAGIAGMAWTLMKPSTAASA